MFGRIRASSSAPDSLERSSSKIFKDDPLSIYEATLMKLKSGSQRKLNSSSGQTLQTENDSALSSSGAGAMDIKSHCSSTSASKCFEDNETSPHEDIMAVDSEFSPGSTSPGDVGSHSTGRTEQQQNGNLSVLYLFSKFKKSQQVASASGDDAMPIGDACCASVSTSSSHCQTLGTLELHMDRQCVGSLPLCPM